MSAACRRFPTPSTTPSLSWVPPTSRCRTTTGATGGRRRIWECSRNDEKTRGDRAGFGGERLHRRRRTCDRDLADAVAPASAPARRRGGRRQDRSGKSAGGDTRDRAHSVAVL